MTAATQNGHTPTNAAAPSLDCLTPLQHTIALMVADGLHNAEIGRRLCKSESTVKAHLSNIYVRLDIETSAGWTPRVRLARVIWETQVNELVGQLVERHSA